MLDMRSSARRLGPLAFAVMLLVGLVPSTAADSTDLSGSAMVAAERRALDLTNKGRTDRGLVRLRLDPRLTELARERARYMAETGTFSHTQSGGTDVFDMIEASDIRWYGAGEIIAWNTAGPLDHSAAFAVQGWMGSPSHKAIVVSNDYNYVGFGLAVSSTTSKRYWVGVYLRGPDRTNGWVRNASLGRQIVDATHVRVTVKWAGGDKRLQVLTAGHRYFQVQARRSGNHTWSDYGTTTATSFTRRWIRGQTYHVRVRSRDRAGNWSAWVSRTLTA